MFSNFAFAHTAVFPNTALPLVQQKVCRLILTFASQWTSSQRERGSDEKMGNLLTFKSSSGRSPPLSMPLLMDTNLSNGGLSFTLGLCRLVLSMMIEKESI